MKTIAESVPLNEFAFAFFTLLQDRPEDETMAEMEAAADEVLAEVFEKSPELIDHFRVRFMALLHVLDHPELEEFTRYDPETEQIKVHPALLAAAAEEKVSGNGRFPRRKLADRAESLKSGEYANWHWDGPG